MQKEGNTFEIAVVFSFLGAPSLYAQCSHSYRCDVSHPQWLEPSFIILVIKLAVINFLGDSKNALPSTI